MADIFNSLMTDALGYETYIAQGGDWGGAMSSWLGFNHVPACAAIHINILIMRHGDDLQGAKELAWASEFEKDQITQNGYCTQQATK